jgi:hypothetical protein
MDDSIYGAATLLYWHASGEKVWETFSSGLLSFAYFVTIGHDTERNQVYMKIKTRLIGLDLDGTVLTSQKELTPYTKEVLAKAIRQGIVVMPATGRSIHGIPKELLAIEGIQYAVTVNGGRIVEVKTGDSIYANLLSPETARNVLKIFCQYDTLREVYYDGIGYANHTALDHISHYMPDKPMADYLVATRVPVEDIWEKFEAENRPLDKVQAIFADSSELAQAEKELEGNQEIAMTGSLGTNIEVNASGVNKGSALLRMGESLGIPREEIMAFGDGMNDLQMLLEVGTGVAMANAQEEVRNAADHIALSNDEEGVARFIEEYVLL